MQKCYKPVTIQYLSPDAIAAIAVPVRFSPHAIDASVCIVYYYTFGNYCNKRSPYNGRRNNKGKNVSDYSLLTALTRVIDADV